MQSISEDSAFAGETASASRLLQQHEVLDPSGVLEDEAPDAVTLTARMPQSL